VLCLAFYHACAQEHLATVATPHVSIAIVIAIAIAIVTRIVIAIAIARVIAIAIAIAKVVVIVMARAPGNRRHSILLIEPLQLSPDRLAPTVRRNVGVEGRRGRGEGKRFIKDSEHVKETRWTSVQTARIICYQNARCSVTVLAHRA